MTNIHTDIVILGTGLGGYSCFRKLNKLVGKNQKILLVDKNNYLTFSPMLHEVASGSIQPSHSTTPIREYLHKTRHQFLKAEILKIHPEKNLVETSAGTIQYRYCVVSIGSTINFFNTPGAENHAHHVKTLDAATKLHSAFIDLLEHHPTNEIHFNIVGGGATGVELAGQFADLAHEEVKKLFPKRKIQINILQSSNDIIEYTHPKTRSAVRQKLESLGVKIMFNSRVAKVETNQLELSDGTTIKSDLTAWTAGFACHGHTLCQEDLCERGRIKTNNYLQSPAYQNLFAVGDIALVNNSLTNNPYPQSGEIADAQGKIAAKNIAALIHKKTPKPFDYQPKGALIPIGEWFAAAEIGPFKFSGRFAWWLRRTVYLRAIPGFIRKLRIIVDWTLNIFAMRRLSDE